MSSPRHPADSVLEELNSYIRYRKRIASKFARRRSLSLHCELNRLRRLVDVKRHELGQMLGSSAAASSSPPPSAHEMMMMMRLQQESESQTARSEPSASYASSPRRTRSHSESMLSDLVTIINQWNDMIDDSKEGLDQGWDVAGHIDDSATLNGERSDDDTSQAIVELATEATETTATTAQRLSMFQRVRNICERVFCKMVAESMDD